MAFFSLSPPLFLCRVMVGLLFSKRNFSNFNLGQTKQKEYYRIMIVFVFKRLSIPPRRSPHGLAVRGNNIAPRVGQRGGGTCTRTQSLRTIELESHESRRFIPLSTPCPLRLAPPAPHPARLRPHPTPPQPTRLVPRSILKKPCSPQKLPHEFLACQNFKPSRVTPQPVIYFPEGGEWTAGKRKGMVDGFFFLDIAVIDVDGCCARGKPTQFSQ